MNEPIEWFTDDDLWRCGMSRAEIRRFRRMMRKLMGWSLTEEDRRNG